MIAPQAVYEVCRKASNHPPGGRDVAHTRDATQPGTATVDSLDSVFTNGDDLR
jgi:hypothetical protein